MKTKLTQRPRIDIHWDCLGTMRVSLLLLAMLGTTYGMDFSWAKRDSSQYSPWELRMTGEIQSGDYEKFRSFLRKDLDRYKESRIVSVSSNGGNLIETFKIIKLLRVAYPMIIVDNGKCASACFFLYLSGVSRLVSPGGVLGIHRAYFDKTYFAGLKPSEAQSQQELLTNAVNAVLDEGGMPQYLRDIMNRTSSDNIYWLSDDDVRNIGIYPAWYEELRIARCGKYLSELKKAEEASKQDAWAWFMARGAAETNVNNCEVKIIDRELPELVKALANDEKPLTKAKALKTKGN